MQLHSTPIFGKLLYNFAITVQHLQHSNVEFELTCPWLHSAGIF